MFLNQTQMILLGRLLRSFFSLPYSTDLDGKDVETIIRLIKDCQGRPSRRKELFDIVDDDIGYSVKTLFKQPSATRVDLQEQRFCDVKALQDEINSGSGDAEKQGRILLEYMRKRILEQMNSRGVKVARSLILLKHWNKERTDFTFRYWEEDFLEYIEDLWDRNKKHEIEWVKKDAGLHGRDANRMDDKGIAVRLLRMHYKHNQIFTDHDIPLEAQVIRFRAQPVDWRRIADALEEKGLVKPLELMEEKQSPSSRLRRKGA